MNQQKISLRFNILSKISIIGVVFIHAKFILSRWQNNNHDYLSSSIQYFFSEELFRLCVPIFFIISGYYHEAQILKKSLSISEIFKKKINTIFVPYIIWTFIFGLLFTLYQNKFNLMPNYWLDLFFKPVPFQFWFLQILTLCFALRPAISFVLKNSGRMFPIILILIYLLDYKTLRSNWHGILFFAYGMYCSGFHIKKYLSLRYMIPIYSILILFNTSIYILSIDLHLIKFITHKISIIIGIFSITSLVFNSNFQINNSILVKVSKSEKGFPFFLFAIHEPTLSFLKSIWINNFSRKLDVLGYFILPSITIICSFYLYLYLKRHHKLILKPLIGFRL